MRGRQNVDEGVRSGIGNIVLHQVSLFGAAVLLMVVAAAQIPFEPGPAAGAVAIKAIGAEHEIPPYPRTIMDGDRHTPAGVPSEPMMRGKDPVRRQTGRASLDSPDRRLAVVVVRPACVAAPVLTSEPARPASRRPNNSIAGLVRPIADSMFPTATARGPP